MIELSEAELLAHLQQHFLVFVRISAWLMVAPITGTRVVTARVKVLLAFMVTLLVAPMVPAMAPPPDHVGEFFSLNLLVSIAHELVIGIALGFAFQVAFQIFVMAGQIIAIKLGLGFASMNDPVNGVQTTVLSQFYLILVTVLFVSADGHLVMMNLIVQSFNSLTMEGWNFSKQKIWQMTALGSWLFAGALLVSLPVVVGLLVINVAFGIMSRAAPQLNIFAVGFPFTLLCGMVLVWMGLDNFLFNYESVMSEIVDFSANLLSIQR